MKCPVVLHVITQKGKGYLPAQEHPKLFHGVGRFDPHTGVPYSKSSNTFSDCFGKTMVQIADHNPKICAITAAMPGGTGLLDLKKQCPKRLFDVGIAEEHAVSMAGGLAKQGMIPVVALYSTFLQRAYDMILQDICMLKLHVVFAVDRAGLVGEDGETHHGIYDVGFLRHAPGLKVLTPASCGELRTMLTWAVEKQTGPVAIRYPRGGERGYIECACSLCDDFIHSGTVFCHRKGGTVTLVTYGLIISNVLEAAESLSEAGIEVSVLRLLTIKPLPVDELSNYLPHNSEVIVVEEVSSQCGICRELAYKLKKIRPDCRVRGLDLGEEYITHGALDVLYHHYGLSAEAIQSYVLEVRKIEK